MRLDFTRSHCRFYMLEEIIKDPRNLADMLGSYRLSNISEKTEQTYLYFVNSCTDKTNHG